MKGLLGEELKSKGDNINIEQLGESEFRLKLGSKAEMLIRFTGIKDSTHLNEDHD